MAQTSSWLSVGEAAVRLGITEHEVHELAISGRIHSRLEDCNHRELLATAVEEYRKRVSEPTTSRGECLAENAKPTVRGGPHIGDNAEREFTASQADYDASPNDEGDEAPCP